MLLALVADGGDEAEVEEEFEKVAAEVVDD